MPRPILAHINTHALIHNYQLAKKRAPHSWVWAVLKANAYGHGIDWVGLALAPIADGFAVLELEEAITLRQLGAKQPILLLEGVFSPEDILVARSYQLSMAITTTEQAEMVFKSTWGEERAIDCWIKINTSMNRLGVNFEEAERIYQRIQGISSLRFAGWMTHFANADNNPEEIKETLARFAPLCQKYPAPCSFANSAAIWQFPQTHREMVRQGIMLYGATPFAEISAKDMGLMPVMSLRSQVIALRSINSGQAVGYGSRYVANCPQTLAVVACGYADGYPRIAKDGTPIGVNGVECPLAGRVSMDMITVDVSKIQQPYIGMAVELWGAKIPVDKVAQNAQTVGYELLCALSRRVPKLASLDYPE